MVNAVARAASPLHSDSASAERRRVADEARRRDVIVHALFIVAGPAVRRSRREAVACLQSCHDLAVVRLPAGPADQYATPFLGSNLVVTAWKVLKVRP